MTYTSKAELVASLRKQISTRESVATRALVALYSMQTSSEKTNEETTELNSVGFNSLDAKLMSSLAVQYNTKGWLSSRQIALCHTILPKYARQLVELSITNGKIRKNGSVYIW